MKAESVPLGNTNKKIYSTICIPAQKLNENDCVQRASILVLIKEGRSFEVTW